MQSGNPTEGKQKQIKKIPYRGISDSKEKAIREKWNWILERNGNKGNKLKTEISCVLLENKKGGKSK